MFFDTTLGLKESFTKDIIKRNAVRGVIIKGNKILMIHSNQGDYKLPGGGIEQGETHQEAVKREIEEETGYKCKAVNEMIGKVLERKRDKNDNLKCFEMESFFYCCEVYSKKGIQKLDDYEKDLDFTPIWIDINEAINKNKNLLESKFDIENNYLVWVKRENYVLEQINKLLEEEKIRGEI